EDVEPRCGFAPRRAFQRVGQNWRRGGGDRAAGALKANVADPIAVHLYVNRNFVAAKRVVPLRLLRSFDGAEVARPLAVVENNVLIEPLKVRHRILIEKSGDRSQNNRRKASRPMLTPYFRPLTPA